MLSIVCSRTDFWSFSKITVADLFRLLGQWSRCARFGVSSSRKMLLQRLALAGFARTLGGQSHVLEKAFWTAEVKVRIVCVNIMEAVQDL
eukprot:5666419-Amphidinium_carterae.1